MSKNKITLIILLFMSSANLANQKTINTISDEFIVSKQNPIHTKQMQATIKGIGTAVISGNIQNDLATPLVDYSVSLFEIISGERQYVREGVTNVSGNYSFDALPAGVYIVHSGSNTNQSEYLKYLWNPTAPIVCTFYNCIVPTNSYISVTDSDAINNIDFIVKLGGRITGTVIDGITNQGVDTMVVSIVNTNKEYTYHVQSTIETPAGEFTLDGIPDGDYRIYLSPLENNKHIPQIFGGPECNGCQRLTNSGIGSILNINMANTINNNDFVLNTGASISGKLVDNDTMNPLLEYGAVLLFNEFNDFLASIVVYGTNYDINADGTYTIGGLMSGSYYVQGGDLGREFYQREIYNNHPCYYSGCDRSMGDIISLSSGENLVGIDFLLDKGGKISGMVTDAVTGLPIVQNPSEARLQVEFYNNVETVVGSALIKDDGSYISARALPAGTYSARTGSMFQGTLTQPYVNQKYPGIDCAGLACDLSDTNIVVTNETITTEINFSLSTGNSFSGTVTDIASSAPVANVHVMVYKDMGAGMVEFANWATTSSGNNGVPIGAFEVTGLPDGTYYARTGYGSDLPFFVSLFSNIGGAAPIGWIDILYDGLTCLADCDVTMGTPIVLPQSSVKLLGTNAVDFSLSQGGIITGTVTDFINNSGLKGITINVYNDQGVFMGSSITDDQGNYITRGLPDGTYYLTTSSLEALLDVKYGNDFCILGLCNPLDADQITLSPLQQATNKDFILRTTYMHMFSDDFE